MSKEKKRIRAAKLDLFPELGTLSTFKQLEKASQYHSLRLNSPEDQFKNKVWKAYVRQFGK
jgi:hypothetical protein